MTEHVVPQESRIEADPSKPYKAYVAFALAFAAALYAQLEGRPTLEGMKWEDWLLVVLGSLVVAGGTYATRNPLVSRTRNL